MKVSPLLITALLLVAGLAAVPAQAHNITSPGVAFVSVSDLTDAGSTVTGIGSVLGIQVKDTARAGASSVTVTVKSQVDSAGEAITLSPITTSGDFFGTVGFESSQVASNGRVYVTDNKVVTVTYTDSSATDQTDTVTYQASVDGTLTLDATTYYGAGTTTATVTVTDADANTVSTTQQTLTVKVTSDSDTTGFLLTLTETGVNTGVFRATDLGFASATASPLIKAVDGDTVTVKYTDSNGATGRERTVTKTATWKAATTGTPSFRTSDYRSDAGTAYTLPATGSYVGLDKAYLRVFDTDKDTTASADTLVVSVSSTSQTTPTQVTLTESGPHTGEFIGSVDLVAAAASGKVKVADGDTITVSYDDDRGADGADPAAKEGYITWDQRVDGTLRWTRNDWVTDAADFYGDDASGTPACTAAGPTAGTLLGVGYIRLDDADLNTATGTADTTTVTVTSSMDPVGVTVTLTESGVNTGIFRGCVEFEAFGKSVSATPSIWVVDGSTVTVTYDDVDAAGATTARTDTATWHDAADGTVDVELADYYSTVGTATVTVQDKDANTAAGSMDTLTVKVRSDSDATGISVTLTEVHANSGVFRGTFGFSTDASSDTTDKIKVSGGGTMYVSYQDAAGDDGAINAHPTTAGCAAATNCDTATWNAVPSAGVVTLPSDKYFSQGSNLVTVTWYDTDGNTGTTTIDTFVATVTSSTDATGISITMTESAANTGVFTGKFGFSTSASSDSTDVIKVTSGDTVTVTSTAVAPAAPATLTWTAGAAPTSVFLDVDNTCSAAAGPDDRFYGVGTRRCARVTDADRNTDTHQVDVINVKLGDETTFGLVETGIDTGVFERVFLMNANGTANDGFAKTTSGSDVTLSYTDTNPSSSTAVTDAVTWYPAGSIAFYTSSAYGTAATSIDGEPTIYFEATDHYENLEGSTSTANSFAVTLGHKDAAGTASVTLTETSANTNIFRGSVALTSLANLPSTATDRADTLTVQYQTLGATGEWLYASVPWARAGTATVQFATKAEHRDTTADAAPSIAAGTKTYNGLSTGYLIVTDAYGGSDLDGTAADTIDVTVKSDSDSTGITVTLRETGANTGVFKGTFSFTTGTSSDSSDTLKVADGDALSASYTDSKRDDGTSGAVSNSNSAAWNAATTATITTDAQKYLEPGSMTVTVTDADKDTTAGLDTVTVTITEQAGTGTETHTLTETAAHSGVFSAVISFIDHATTSTGTVTDGSVSVNDRDKVTITYTDATTESGVSASPYKEIYWYRLDTQNSGYATLDADDYYTASATGTITVKDPDMDTTFSADTVQVRVVSASDGVGALVTLTETGGETDIFTGTLSFEASYVAGNDKVFVQDGDLITVIYVDKADAASTAGYITDTDTAVYHATTNTAPTATLTVTPASGAPPLAVTFTMGGTDDSGISSWSLDINNDGTADYTGTDDLKAASKTQAHTYSDEGTYTAKLTVTDASSLTATATVTVTVAVADVTAPSAIAGLAVVSGSATANSVQLTWTAPGDDADTGTVTSYDIRYSTSTITDSDFASATAATATFSPSTLGAAGTTQTATITGLDQNTVYYFAVKAKDEVPNTGALSNVVSATTLEDTTAPTGTLVIASSTHPTTAGVVDDAPAFSWSGLADAESTIEYYYAFNQVADYAIDKATDAKTTETNIVFPDTAVGTWYLHVLGSSAGGDADQVTYQVTILSEAVTPPTQSEIADHNAALQDTVTTMKVDGGIQVSWGPSAVPDDAAGVSLWRINSPAVWVADVLAGTSAFTLGKYVDAAGKDDSTYLVTVYFGDTAELGYSTASITDLPGYTGLSEDEVAKRASEPAVAPESWYETWWVWVLVAVGVLVLVGLIVLGIVMSRRGKDEGEWDSGDDLGWVDESEGGEWGAEPEEAVEGETHHMECPECHTHFSATGSKPLVTTCPGCGKSGVLR